MTEQERIRNRILKSGKFPTSPTAASPAAAGAFTPTAMFKNTPSTPAPSYASAYAEAIRSGDASENKTPYTKVMFETFGDDLSHGIDSAVKLGKGWKPVEEVERVETEVENLLPRTKSYVEYYNTLNPGNKFYTVPKSANYTDRIIKGDSEKIDEHFKKSPSNLSAYMHGLSNYVKDTKKNYAQYENKEAYDRVNNEATKLSNMSSDELKLERIGSKSDVTLLERFNELEGYKASIDDAVTSEDKRIAQEHMNAFLNAYGYSDYDSAYKDLYERTKHIPIGKTNKVAYMLPDGQTIMWDDLISDAEHNEYTKEYFTKVSANPDFTAKSTYHKKSVKYESTIIIGEGEYYEPSTKEDQMAHYYNLVNNDPTAVDSCEKTYLTSRGKEDYRYRMYLSEDEKKVFNYLYETQGYESAREYVENMKNILERRRLQDDIKSYTEFAEENPVTASVISTLSSPITNLSGFVGGITGADKTSGLYAGTHFTNTVRSTVENNINSGLGKFLYRHGMNVADNVVALAMGGFGRYGKLSKAATQTIMSTGAFSQAVLNAKERGLSDEEAIFLGAIAGASEYFFESKGFDALFDKDGLMKESAWKYWLNSLKTEEIGELGTELTNDVFDVLVSQDASEWKREIDSYIVSGMTQREAVSKAIGNAASRYGDIALGTLFSTGVMSGAPAVASSAKQAYTDSKTGSWLRSDNADADGEITRSVINEGLDSAPDTESYTYAERMRGRTDAGKKVSDRQLGHMYRANAEAVNTENNTASDIETAEGNYSLDNITGMRSPGYMVNKSPAHLLFEGDVTDPVENAKRYNVIDAEKLSPQTQLEKDVADSALDIGMNNTDATHSLVNTAMKISSESGVPVTFVTTERLKNMGYNTNKYNISGVYSPYNGILINAESPKAGQAILGHELVHWLQGNRLYNSFSKVIKQYSTEVGTYQTTFDGIKNLYSTVKNADYDAETVAELTGAYLFTDEAFVSKLAEHRNLFQRIYDKIRHYYNLATAGSPEARLLERAKYIFEKAYRSQRGNTETSNNETYYNMSQETLRAKDINWDPDNFSSLKKQLTEHEEEVNAMHPVANVVYSKRDSIPYYKVLENLINKTFSNKIDVKDFGVITFDKNAISSLRNYITNDSERAAAISAPYVIKKGKVISGHKNHKEEGNVTLTFAAPVILNGIRGNVAVSVMYGIGRVHSLRVLTPEGNTFELLETNNTESTAEKYSTSAARNKTADNLHINSVSNYKIPQFDSNVNSDFSLTPKKNVPLDESPDINVDDMEVSDFVFEEDEGDVPFIFDEDVYSEPSQEFDGRSFEELMGLDGTEKNTSTSKVPEIKLPTAEDILSGNYTPATPVTPPVKEIKPMTDEEARASVWGEETPPSEDIDFENVDFENEADMPRKYDFTVDKSAVSERFSRMLEARQNTLDELISQRYNIEESFNDEISYLEMQYRDMKNPEITKKGIALSKRITKLKEQRDTRLAEMDAQIEKARKRVDDLDEKEYSRMVQRRAIEQERQDFISKTVGSTVNWKDKPGGAFLYDLNTLRRNLRDIVRDANGKPDIELADRIYDMLQGAYSRHEAQMKQEILSIADKFAALKINNVESTYIQMLGELRSNPDTTLTQEEVEEFYRDHKKKIDTDKVEKAIAMARETYDSLFNRLNEVLREQGMKEIPYRQGYFPHYTKEKNGFFAKLLNWKSKNNSLPTDIAGLTEEFNPKKSYQPFDKRREGDTTEYNFLEGLDNYVRGALDWIYHIEDIALRRSFEDYIRYEHSEKAMRDKIDDIRSEGLDPEEERVLIDDALKGRAHQLGNFLAYFRAQTNVLAGKKHSGDRTVEQEFGRGTYSFAQNVSSRINGNMVAANVASALTNFIPLTQSWAEVSPKQTLIAMKDTIKSFKHDDGIREKSVFLTNRLTEDKRLYQTGWDKASDKAAALMGAIDSFTSETIWRSKYAQNLEKGMSEDEAIANADDYCAGLIASRSRGEMPGTFDKKNVFAKVLTSFQLEVNNQYGYLFKDLPKNKETKLGVVWGLVKMFLGAYGFNWLYEKITGRRPALDPIGMVAAFIDDIAEDDEDKWMNLSESLLEQVPFVGGLFGGGRIPLQSAVPDVNNMNDIESIVWELAKPAAYLALPTGGGQLYKTAKGIDAIAKGGSYKTDSKGNEILQYPYYSDEGANSIFQGTKAVLFGKNSLPTAGDWVDSGFESLNADQTKAYEGMISAGDKQRKSYEFINKLKSLETAKDKRQALNDSDFSDEAKYSVYYNMLADKNENDPEKDERYAVLDNLEDHSAINTILAVKTSEDNHGKIQAVANAQLTSNDRALIIKEYISEDAYKEATDLTRKGLTYDEYFDAYFTWDKIKADNKDSKVRRTEFAHWLNKNGKNMNSTERAALREALIGEGETSYDKLVGAGVSDKGAYEVGLKLDKLDPDPYTAYKTVQPYQKYQVIVNSDLTKKDITAAMKAISTDAQAKKIQRLADAGIDLELFADLAQNIGKADKSVWSVSNSELQVWINRLSPPVLELDSRMTWPQIKSTMYSILTENKNNSSVPSSTHIKMVLDKHYGRTK